MNKLIKNKEFLNYNINNFLIIKTKQNKQNRQKYDIYIINIYKKYNVKIIYDIVD